MDALLALSRLRDLVDASEDASQSAVVAILDRAVAAVRAGRVVPRAEVGFLLLPTGPLQEIAIDGGWGDDFTRLATAVERALDDGDLVSAFAARLAGGPQGSPWAGDRRALAALYAIVPGPLPRLFEELLLSFRWTEGAVDGLRLFPNPPGAGLEGFLAAVTSDDRFYPALFASRLAPFAWPASGDRDPVCFDVEKRRGDDCPVIRVDHEGLLARRRVELAEDVAGSFRALLDRISGGPA